MKCSPLPCEHQTWINRYSGPHLTSVFSIFGRDEHIQLTLTTKETDVFWHLLGSGSLSKKEHRVLVPWAVQIRQQRIYLETRNDWRVQGNGGDDVKIYPVRYWNTSWPWAY